MEQMLKEIRFGDACNGSGGLGGGGGYPRNIGSFNEIRLEQAGILGLLSVREGSDLKVYRMEEFEEIVSLEEFDDDYNEGLVTSNNLLYSPYELDQFGDQDRGIFVYDNQGNLTDDINLERPIGVPDAMHEGLDYIYYSYGGGTEGNTGIAEMTTGNLITSVNKSVAHSGYAAIVEGVGVVCYKVVDSEPFLVLLDFDLNQVWEQTVEPHPEITNSDGINALRVGKDGDYIYAFVSVGNNDVVAAKFDITDGSLIGQLSVDTKLGGGGGESMWLDFNDKIYLASGQTSDNGEDWVVEVINPDMTFHKKLYMDNDQGGEPLVTAGHDINHLKDNIVFFAGYYSGSSPTTGFWAYYDVTTEEIQVLDDHLYEYGFLDAISITGGRPYQR